MSVSEQERSFRRRVLYTALPEGVSPSIAQSAISILDQEFGMDPEFHFGKLIQRLHHSFGPTELQLNQVLRRILVLKKQDVTTLHPDPTSGTTSNLAVAAPPVAVGTGGRLTVFNTLFGELAGAASRRGQNHLKELHSHFTTAADELGLSTACRSSLKLWAGNPGSAPSVSGSTDELHRIINSTFVWLCGKFGPVDADKIVLRAVDVAGRLPEADICPPRTYL